MLTQASRRPPLLRDRRRRPRRDDGAHQVPRGVAELGLLGGAHLLFLDDAPQELALELRSRDGVRRGRAVRERIAERGDLVAPPDRARAPAPGTRRGRASRRGSPPSRPRRARLPCPMRLSTSSVDGAGAFARVASRGSAAAIQLDRLVLDAGRTWRPACASSAGGGVGASLRSGSGRAHAAPRAAHPRRSQRRPPAATCRPHSPITLTTRRLSRWPSNSA